VADEAEPALVHRDTGRKLARDLVNRVYHGSRLRNAPPLLPRPRVVAVHAAVHARLAI